MKQNVERPIETERQDRLLRQDLVVRLLAALIEPEGRATGVVLGLAGPSGSGKSSILNMVTEAAEARHPAAVVVTFNPWLANSRNGLIHAFFAEVTAALETSAKRPGCAYPEKLKGMAQAILKYGKRVAPADNVWQCDGGAAASGLDMLRQSLPGGDPLRDMRAQICRELDESGIDVVVLIDEIDRLDDSEVAVIAQLVRAVADFECFSYLLAYDAGHSAKAMPSAAGPTSKSLSNCKWRCRSPCLGKSGGSWICGSVSWSTTPTSTANA
jgi:Cdc6-like AAA superfamily ATPase